MTQKMKKVVESIEKWRNNEIDETLGFGHTDEHRRYYLAALLKDPITELGSDGLVNYMYRAGYSNSLIQAVMSLTKQGIEFIDKLDWALRWTATNDRLIEVLEAVRSTGTKE